MSKLRSPRLDCSMTMGTSCEMMSRWSVTGDWFLSFGLEATSARRTKGSSRSPAAGPSTALRAVALPERARGGMRKVGEPADLAAAAGDGVEDEAGKDAKHGDDDHSGNEDRGGHARHQPGREIGEDERDREEDREGHKKRPDAAVEQPRPLDAVEGDDGLQDPPAVAIGRELGLRAFGKRGIGGLALADRHAELERVDADLGLDLEARGEDREAFHKAAREHPVTRENVAEAAPEQAGEEPGEGAVAGGVAAAVGVLLLVAAGGPGRDEPRGGEGGPPTRR